MILDLEFYDKAADDTAKFMTADLRSKALSSGWDPEVVQGMSVEYGDSGHVVRFTPEVQDRAFVHEYGDEKTPPTAVIRKYRNNSPEADKFYMRSLRRHVEGPKE